MGTGALEQRSRRGLAQAAPARRRGLGEVLHYFISEEEQRSALARAERPVTQTAPRWCLLAEPERPMLCALGLDLAAALARAGRGAVLLAPLARPALLPRAAQVRWETCGDMAGEPGTLLRRLEQQPADLAVLLLAPPARAAAILEHPAAAALDGLLLPVDASARGVARALDWLRAAGAPASRLRIGALLVGAPSAAGAEEAGERLARSARRELGLEVEPLAHVERDEASYRSLLQGQSIVDLDSSSRAAASLHAVSRRLLERRGRV